MQFIKAIFSHSWLVMRMKHDGTGMPEGFVGALLLITTYIALVTANKHLQHALTIETVLALVFIAQFYLFSIRNAVIGLVILIGIIGNVFALAMAAFGEVSSMQVLLLSMMQSLLIFGALINVIRTHSKAL